MSLGSGLEEALAPRQRHAVLTAIDLLADEFFGDVGHALADEDFANLFMADLLPRKYLPRYTPLFAKKFTTCLLTVAWKLTAPGSYQLACVAEELALRAIFERTSVVLELDHDAGEEDIAAIEDFADDLFEDHDFELLFDPRWDGIEDAPEVSRLAMVGLKFEEWFLPFRPHDPVHPYVADSQNLDEINTNEGSR